MKTIAKSFIISIVILFMFAGCQSPQMDLGSKFDEHICTACDKGKAGEAVWCDSCNAGFIDGKKVTCKGCFDSKTKGTVCETCQKKEGNDSGYLITFSFMAIKQKGSLYVPCSILKTCYLIF